MKDGYFTMKDLEVHVKVTEIGCNWCKVAITIVNEDGEEVCVLGEQELRRGWSMQTAGLRANLELKCINQSS